MKAIRAVGRAWARPGILFAATLASGALLADDFPNRQMTVIVPSTPGGILDQTGRLLALELNKSLGQGVVVENKAGGGQVIAMQALLSSPADGYTMVMGSIGPNAVNYSLQKRLPYGPQDFIPIAHFVSMPNVLLAHPSVPANSLSELVALARAKPGTLSIASSGIGTSSHLSGELLKAQAGINLVHVPYKGASPAIADLLSGQVNLYMDNLITAIPQIKAGKLKALAVTSGTRAVDLPDVPTIKEAGYPDYDVSAWVGVFVKGGTPEPVVGKLHDSIVKILQRPDIRERVARMGGSSIPMTQPQFADFVNGEIRRWTEVVQKGNIQVE